MKIVIVAGILVAIPTALYLVAMWVDFWLNRSLGQWMACGLGIPLALGIALILLLPVKSRADPLPRKEK